MTTTAAEPPLMPLLAVYMKRCAQRKEKEFFEPQLMSSPPPMAEQFLYDLRKMITCARERIRTRRHVPRLPPVVESEDEGPVGGNGNVAIGKLAKNSEEFEAEILEKDAERPKINEAPIERRRDEELALSMEEIVREQQKRRDKKEAEKVEEKVEENEEENEGELVHQRRDGKMEENGSSTSARSSMDSGRGSEKREEEEMQEEQGKEEETRIEEIGELKNGEENELEEHLKEHLEEENAQNVEENENEIVENVADEEKMPQPSNNLPTLNSSIPSIQQQSRIPVGTASTSNNAGTNSGSGKSPRLQLKFTAFCRRPPPLPPRPPPPPPASNAPGKLSAESPTAIEGKPKMGQNPLAAMKRRIATNIERNEPSKLQQPSSIPIGNSYAVCPPPSFACADRMKKSLPRRKKAIVPMAPNVTTATTPTVLPKATPTAV